MTRSEPERGKVVKHGRERRTFQTEGMVRTKELRTNLDFNPQTRPLKGFLMGQFMVKIVSNFSFKCQGDTDIC